MTDFKTYYNSKFRDDINQFFSTIPDTSRFHEDTENKQTFSIQYGRLTPASDHLDFLDKDGKELFAVALFLTVLTDMVCFSHFKTHYNKFRNLTGYPKFIGNCPSGCNYHFHPRVIFFAMNKGRSATEQHLVFYDKFLGAIETGGCLYVFEHNPYNPVTRHVFENCPFDVHAEMLTMRQTTQLATNSGLHILHRAYTLFFPRPLKVLRPLERFMGRLPLGAQYYVQMGR